MRDTQLRFSVEWKSLRLASTEGKGTHQVVQIEATGAPVRIKDWHRFDLVTAFGREVEIE
jgi:hypothetical protein